MLADRDKNGKRVFVYKAGNFIKICHKISSTTT